MCFVESACADQKVSILYTEDSQMRTKCVNPARVHVAVEIVDDVMAMPSSHFLRSYGEGVESRPYALCRLAVCHTYARRIVIGAIHPTDECVSRRMELRNEGTGRREDRLLDRSQMAEVLGEEFEAR